MDRLIPHVVSVEWLAEHLEDATLRVVDVRWKLGDADYGERAYALGHLPGAVCLSLDRDLASPPGVAGRHPLPSAAAFAQAMERVGICDGTRVVAYDDQAGAIASRLWFLLRYFGHETGAVLDGGLAAWTAAGHPLTAALPAPPRGLFASNSKPGVAASREEVLQALEQGALLLDARAGERYRGEVEPIDPRPGHIPRAINAPFSGNLNGGLFLSTAKLAERYRALGVGSRPTIVYCGSGVTACHDALAIAVASLPMPRVYVGSWSEWSRDPEAPVELGASP